MSIDNMDFRILMHTSALVRQLLRIPRTYGVSNRYFCMYVLIYDELRSNILGFPEALGFIRSITTGAFWARPGRKPFSAFRQPKLSTFGPYTAYGIAISEK